MAHSGSTIDAEYFSTYSHGRVFLICRTSERKTELSARTQTKCVQLVIFREAERVHPTTGNLNYDRTEFKDFPRKDFIASCAVAQLTVYPTSTSEDPTILKLEIVIGTRICLVNCTSLA
jgi:hypothetical protein